MEIKKHNAVVIAISVIVAAVICYAAINKKNTNRYDSRVFKVVNGWGYDILVNDKLIIHQESVPVLENKQPFQKSDEAMQTAQLVVTKLKKGEPPSLTKFDLEKIIRARDSEIIKQGNTQ